METPTGIDLAARCGGSADLSERLRVVAVEGARVRLLAQRASGCAACAARNGCGAGALAALGGAAELDLAAPQRLDLVVGEEVEVAMSSADFLTLAGLAYLLPPLTLALGAALAAALELPDLLSAALCLPLLALSLVPVARAERSGRFANALRIAPVAPAASSCRSGS